MKRRAGATLVAIVTLAAPSAHADDLDACATSFEQSQRLRESKHLKQALESAIVCARTCPASLRSECTGWIGSIRDALPSIAVRVLGEDGCDVASSKLTIDGEPFVAPAGRAVEVDPGSHVLRVELDGRTRELPLIVTEGERSRAVAVSFALPGAVCGGPKPPVPAPSPPTNAGHSTRSVPIASWVLGGVGVAALGVGGTFGVVGLSKMSDLESCRPRCAHEDADAMRRSFVIADIGIGIGAVALAGAIALYFLQPERERVAWLSF